MIKRGMFALAALGILGTASANAESLFFDNYCTVGAFRVCASVRVFSSGNSLTMQVWNLQGVQGAPHTLTALGLYHSGPAWTGHMVDFQAWYVTGTGPNDRVSIKPMWSGDALWKAGGPTLEVGERTRSGHTGGIVGCTDPGGATHFATCGSSSNYAFVEFNFTLSQPFSLGSIQLAWTSQQVGANAQGLARCDTTPGGVDFPCTVAPEPITMALLGTGLMGLGGAGLIRRRRDKDVVNG